jgi:hypothetical protein
MYGVAYSSIWFGQICDLRNRPISHRTRDNAA